MTDPGLPLTTGEGNKPRQFHIRREHLLEGSALDVDPPFASLDVVLRQDYEAECGRLRERVEQLQTALGDLTPSDDGGGYGPNNAEAWKDAYIDRLREALDAERLAGRLREQLDAARQAQREALLLLGQASGSESLHRAKAVLRAALGVVGPTEGLAEDGAPL